MFRTVLFFRGRSILAVMLLVLLRCVYFNTFYNAEVAYSAARRGHEDHLKEYPDTSATSLPPTVIEEYDSAISKSIKVLTIYSKQESWHDDAVFLIGRSLFYKGEYENALKRFRQILEEFPQSNFIPEAYFYLGKTLLAIEQYDKAEEMLQTILERYPHQNTDNEVSLLLAEIAIRRGSRAQAISMLESLRGSMKTVEEKMDLYLRIAGLYIDLGTYDKAISLLQSAPRKKIFAEKVYKIDDLLSTCLIKTDSLSAALTLLERMLKQKVYEPHRPEILLKKGMVLRHLGQTDKAVAIFEKVIEESPSTPFAGRAWYELAVIYQKEKEDYAQAYSCFQEAGSLLSDSSMREIAKKRTSAIEQLRAMGHLPDSLGDAGEDTTLFANPDSTANDSLTDSTLTDTLVADTTSPDSAALDNDSSGAVQSDFFRIGEIFWLGLDEPDSAYTYYRKTVSDSTTQPDSVPKALFAAGWIALNAMGDTSRSDSIFDTLIARYPSNEYAQEAQRARDDSITVHTRIDSLLNRYSQAEAAFFERKDAEASAEKFYKTYQNYTDDPVYGAKSLYAAAWLNDHVLEKNVTAFKQYKELCEKFPESSLCTEEAQPRIRIVEDTLNVRRARKEAAKKSAGKRSLVKPSSGREEASPPSDKVKTRPESSPVEDLPDTLISGKPPSEPDQNPEAEAESEQKQEQTTEHDNAPDSDTLENTGE